MSRPSAEVALSQLLTSHLGQTLDSLNTIPQALQKLAEVRPPFLTLRCREHPLVVLGEVHRHEAGLLFVTCIRRNLRRMPGAPNAAGEFGRVVTISFWLDDIAFLHGRCNECPRNIHHPVEEVTRALAARRAVLPV